MQHTNIKTIQILNPNNQKIEYNIKKVILIREKIEKGELGHISHFILYSGKNKVGESLTYLYINRSHLV